MSELDKFGHLLWNLLFQGSLTPSLSEYENRVQEAMVCAVSAIVFSSLSPNVYLTFQEASSRQCDYCLQEPYSMGKEEQLNNS